MKKSNDQFELNPSVTLTLRGKVLNSSQVENKLLPIMKVVTLFANELLKTMLLYRGEKYTLNGIFYSKEKDVLKQMKDIYKKNKIKDNLETFVKECKGVYESFVYYKTKKNELKMNSKARHCANIFFSSKSCKIPFDLDCFKKIKNNGLLPIKVNGKTLDEHLEELDKNFKGSSILKYGIAHEVLSKIKSFEELSKDYENEKGKWHEVYSSAMDLLPLIERYGELLEDVKNILEYNGFKIDNYKRLLCNWRGSEERKKEGMRDYFLQKLKENKNHQFQESDRYLFGYSAELMNKIFHEYQDLWVKEDIMGMQRKEKKFKGKDYVDVVFNHFHWLKETIEISSFDRNGKYVGLHLGDNFVPFTLLKNENNVFEVHFKSPTNKNDIKLTICRCPQFSETTSIKMIKDINDENQDAKKETILLRYCGDVNKKTYYTGSLKEPIVRFDIDKNAFFVNFVLTNHKQENTEDNDDLKKIRYYYNSALPYAERQKQKYNIPDGTYRMMGIDFGLKNTFVGQIYEVSIKDGKVIRWKYLKCVKPFENSNVEKCDYYWNIIHKVRGVHSLLSETQKMIIGKIQDISSENLPKNLEIDIARYMEYIRCKMVNITPEQCFKELRKSQDWIIKEKISDLKKEIGKIKSEWQICPSTMNCGGFSDYLKKQIIKDYNSLALKFSTMGLKSSETDYIRKNFCKRNRKLHKGYSRRIHSRTSSDIINAARADDVSIVFIEDLDCSPSLMYSKKENSLKSLWGVGKIKKWLAHKANKHNIAIVTVDPYLTSTMHYKTGRLCYEHGREIWDFQKGKTNKIDRDENAAHNVFFRGLFRHANLRQFKVDQIDNKTYRISSDEFGKRKQGALFHNPTIKSTECLFQRQSNGNLKVIKTKLSFQEKKMPKINNKAIYAIYHGKQWKLRHELNEELELLAQNHKKKIES